MAVGTGQTKAVEETSMNRIPIGMNLRWCIVRIWALFTAMAGLPLLAASAVLDPPDLRCASVLANGGVQLTWQVPADPGGDFLRYEVFHATAATGPYGWVGQVNSYATTTFTHLGAGANAAPQFYYLTTVSTSGPPNTSANSDTLATSFLQVTQSVPLGSAVLNWTSAGIPSVAAELPFGYVERGTDQPSLQIVDSVAAALHHWQWVVDICEDSLVFRITQWDASGCVAQSNVHGAVFQDITPPAVPNIVAITVDTATNQAVLHWNPSPEPDTDGYIIVLNDGGTNTIVDTIYGQFNTSYTWPASDAGLGPESYTVAAIDTCWKGTPPSPNTSAASAPHTTVYLHTRYDACAKTIRVQRTDYVGWPVDHYDLFRRIGQNGTWSLVAALAPTTLDHVLTGVLPDTTYCFVVRAVGTDTTRQALSNQVCRTTSYPPTPQWNYLRTATVEAPDRVLVVDSLDTGGFTRRVVLERSLNGSPWEAVASTTPTGAATVSFTDLDVNTAERSYSYRVLVEDSCGNTVATSNMGNSLLLTATAGPGGINHLRWNGYVQWAGSVLGYDVYRSVADGPFQWLATMPPNQWAMDDNVESLSQSPGKFCYYVEASETGNASGINATSTSNVACSVQHEEVWVPNAFIEGGYNNTFQPVLAYADVNGYELTIFNRWGQAIWTTNNPYQAWNGQVNGTTVPQGVYAWYCSFRNGAGRTVEKRGTVTFLPGR